MLVVVVAVYGAVIVTLSLYIEAYQLTIGPCPLQIDEPCDTGIIKFYLHHNASYVQLLDPFKPKLPGFFNKSVPTKIIIHGYSGSLDYATTTLTRVNVIAVDWNLLAQLPCYPTAVLNTWQAGQCTAVLIVSLAALGIDPRALHILGFSLGAHVASFAGNWIFSTMGLKLSRITGLDPALPFFATLKPDWKLDSTDAEFVDIIHTNSGIYGKVEASGHTDFYVNGGTFQPTCANHKNPPLCSHMLAPIYFAESIAQHGAFRGVRCGGYIQYMLGWCRGGNSTLTNADERNGDASAAGGIDADQTASSAIMGEIGRAHV